jgi:hypothetical protein
MNKLLFQKNLSAQFRDFIESPLGMNFLKALNSMRPVHESPKEEHLFIANKAQIQGYDSCISNILNLCLPPPLDTSVEANYGVPDPKPEEEKPEPKTQ